MAAGVDFGDLELFEAFGHPEESMPKPVHTRFKDDDGAEEDENGVGDAELQARLRQCEETIEQLRAQNILVAPGPRERGRGSTPCLPRVWPAQGVSGPDPRASRAVGSRGARTPLLPPQPATHPGRQSTPGVWMRGCGVRVLRDPFLRGGLDKGRILDFEINSGVSGTWSWAELW